MQCVKIFIKCNFFQSILTFNMQIFISILQDYLLYVFDAFRIYKKLDKGNNKVFVVVVVVVDLIIIDAEKQQEINSYFCLPSTS